MESKGTDRPSAGAKFENQCLCLLNAGLRSREILYRLGREMMELQRLNFCPHGEAALAAGFSNCLANAGMFHSTGIPVRTVLLTPADLIDRGNGQVASARTAFSRATAAKASASRLKA